MKENKPVQPSPAVAVPKPQQCCSYWRNDAIENAAVIAERYGNGFLAQDIRAMLSTPTPPSAEPNPRGCELVGIYQLKRMSGIGHPDSAAISKSGPSTDSGVE